MVLPRSASTHTPPPPQRSAPTHLRRAPRKSPSCAGLPAHLPGWPPHPVPRGDGGGGSAAGGPSRGNLGDRGAVTARPGSRRGARESLPGPSRHNCGSRASCEAGLAHPAPPSRAAGAGVRRGGRRRVGIVSPWVSAAWRSEWLGERARRAGPHHPPLGSRPRARAPAPRLPGSRFSPAAAPPLPGGCRAPLTLETPGGRAVPSRSARYETYRGVRTSESFALLAQLSRRPSLRGH